MEWFLQPNQAEGVSQENISFHQNVIFYLFILIVWGQNIFFSWGNLSNHNTSREIDSLGKFNLIYNYTERKLKLII